MNLQANLDTDYALENNRALEALFEIASRPSSLEEMLQSYLETLLEISWLSLRSRGGIFLADAGGEGNDELRLVVHKNLKDQALKQTAQATEVRLTSNHLKILDDIAAELTDIYPSGSFSEGMTKCGFYKLPILAGDELIGLLVLDFPLAGKRDKEQTSFLQRAAGVLSLAISLRRKEAELEKRNRELNFKKIALDEHAIVSIADVTGKITYANDKFCEITGFAREELIGENHRILNSGYHPPEFWKNFWETISSGKPWHGDVKNKRKDGSYYWVRATVTPFLNEKGKPFQYVAIRTDITQQKQMEAELENRNRELGFQQKALDEHAIVSIADVTGKITYANDKFCEITGFSREELIGQKHRILNSGYHPPEFWDEFWETISSGKPWHGDVKNKRKDGSEYWVHATVTPFLNEKGLPFQYVAIRTDITQQKQMEAELERRNRTLSFQQKALDEHAIVSIADVTGKITYANDKFCEITGFAREELIGENHRILNSGYHPPEFWKDFWETISSGKPWHGDVKNKRKDGSYYWVRATVTPFLNEKGKPFQYVAIRTDITQQKQMEAELENRNRELGFQQKALDEHAIVSIADVTGKITYANDKFCEITGFSREELIGRNHRILNSGYHPPEFWQDFWKTISSGMPWHGDVKNKRKDGSEYWVRASVTPFLNEKGKPFQYVAIRTDITQQKQMETELANRNRELGFQQKALDEHAIVSIANAGGRITYANDKFCEITGFSREELVGQNHRILNSGYHPPEFWKDFWETISSGKPWHGDVKNKRKDGSEYWVRATVTPFLSEKGRPFQYVAIRTDITQQKQMEAALLQAQRVAKMGSWTLEARTGESVWSEEIYRIFGVDPLSVDGGMDAFLDFVYKEDVQIVGELFQASIEKGVPFDKEYRIVRQDNGEIRWVHEKCIHELDENGRVIRSSGTVQDITERMKALAEIERLAMTDQLTSLSNRNFFNIKFDQSLKLAVREEKILALMMLDLDKFKPINDTYGHLVGDAVLQGVANVFKEQCRETDIIARLGGDEFAILLIHPNSEADVARVADRIIREVRKPMQVGEDELNVGVSIGVAMFPEVDTDVEGLIKKADLALYEAKDAGRNCVRFYRPPAELEEGVA